MKLRNKKTGEIVENAYIRESHDFYNKRTIAVFVRDGNHPPERVSTGYETLAALNAEWDDVPEEPKEYWHIFGTNITKTQEGLDELYDKRNKVIGNYFETKEESEKAVEKLKAFKRLKDKQFKFYGWSRGSLLESKPNTIEFACDDTKFWDWEDIQDDLELLFGGEE